MMLFVDLDGVLNQLQVYWCEAIHKKLREHITLEDIRTWDRLKPRKYHVLLEEPGFFAKVPIMPGAQQALQLAQADGHELYIATAATKWDYFDKVEWVRRWFPFIEKDAFIAANRKSLLAAPGRVLIDDRDKNVLLWRKAGGHGIVFDHPWNRHVPGFRMKGWHELDHLLRNIEGARTA